MKAKSYHYHCSALKSIGLFLFPARNFARVIFFMVFFGFLFEAFPQYSGGDGSQNNPYQIATTGDLILLSETPADWDKWFLQTANIDATITQTLNDGAGFSPIGNSVTKFTGKYNGGNFTISNLYINRPTTDSVGLFGVAISPFQLSNLRIENATVTGRSFVGILAGRAHAGNIINCHTGGGVTATDANYARVGGLVGSSGSVIENCSSSAAVSATKDIAGGLIGFSTKNVTKCFATGSVAGQNNVGGLIGNATFGTVSQCFATTSVSGMQRVGGFIGNAQSNVQINNCFAISAIESNTSYTGGFVGLINSDNVVISKCFAATSIGVLSGYAFIGGFAGKINLEQNIQNCFWDTIVSGTALSDGGVGLPSVAMKDKSTYLNAGWDFVCETNNGTADLWGINPTENSGYPFLIWQGYSYDVEPPIVEAYNDIELDADENCQAVLPDFTASVVATDNCTPNAALVKTQLPPAGTVIDGTTTVTIGVSDLWGNTATISFQALIKDNTAPVITSTHSDIELDADENCQAVLPDFTASVVATDNCTTAEALLIIQTPAAETLISGAQSVTLQVVDQLNNVASVSFLVTVVDNVSPSLICPADTTIYIEFGQNQFVVQDDQFLPNVSDNCGIQSLVNNFNNTETLNGAELSVGAHTIRWTAQDLTGNTTSCEFIITIEQVVDLPEMIYNQNVATYPNPTSGNISFTFVSDGDRWVSITDLQGRVVLEAFSRTTNMVLDIGFLPAGIYFAQIRKENAVSLVKIVKK